MPAAQDLPASTFAPWEQAAFRRIWLVWLAANLCVWMHDVASAWRMATLTNSAMMVALVQSAATLPLFLLGLPCGALADLVDSRRFLALAHVWVTLVAMALAALSFAGALTASLLLAGALCNGVGMAMRWPLFAAIVPSLVPREQLTAALALNGIAANLARIAGPLIAGAVLAGAGAAWVFALNAVVSLVALYLVLRWQPERNITRAPQGGLGAAMRTGLQYVRHCPQMQIILARIFLFFFQVAALTALLPFVAGRLGAGADAYTVLLVAMASGAILVAFRLASLRRRARSQALVGAGIGAHALASALAVLAPTLWLAAVASAVAGMAWLVAANAMTVTIQLALPHAMRARGMAIYQMAVMGGSAVGAACWGALATATSVPASILTAAAVAPVVFLLTCRHEIDADFFVRQTIDTARGRE